MSGRSCAVSVMRFKSLSPICWGHDQARGIRVDRGGAGLVHDGSGQITVVSMTIFTRKTTPLPSQTGVSHRHPCNIRLGAMIYATKEQLIPVRELPGYLETHGFGALAPSFAWS